MKENEQKHKNIQFVAEISVQEGEKVCAPLAEVSYTTVFFTAFTTFSWWCVWKCEVTF